MAESGDPRNYLFITLAVVGWVLTTFAVERHIVERCEHCSKLPPHSYDPKLLALLAAVDADYAYNERAKNATRNCLAEDGGVRCCAV